MLSDMTEITWTILALCGALIVFGLHVVIGRYVVQWLGLPTELPDDCRFEPRPPAAHSDSADAAQRAADHAERAKLAAHGKQAWTIACEIHQRSEDLALLKKAEAQAMAAAEAIHAPQLADGYARCDAIIADLTTMRDSCPAEADDGPPRARLIILMVVLILAMAWMVWGVPMMRAHVLE